MTFQNTLWMQLWLSLFPVLAVSGTDIKTASGDPGDQSDLDFSLDASRDITPQEWNHFAEEVNRSKYFYEDPEGLEGSKAIRLKALGNCPSSWAFYLRQRSLG